MRPFTPEAAEQVISNLCYTRTEDRYLFGPRGNPAAGPGAFRLARAMSKDSPVLALSDIYDPTRYRTITVEEALRQGLLDPSWEDFAAKLFLNDQDILYLCLMSREEPVHVRLSEVERLKAYRNQHNDKAMAAKFTYMPRVRRSNVVQIRKAAVGPGKQDRTGEQLSKAS